MSKICTKCAVDLPLKSFDYQRRGKFGRRSQCRECIREMTATDPRLLAAKKWSGIFSRCENRNGRFPPESYTIPQRGHE